MQKWLMSFSMGVILRRSASGGYEFDIKKSRHCWRLFTFSSGGESAAADPALGLWILHKKKTLQKCKVFLIVAEGRVELPALGLWILRSNHLSYPAIRLWGCKISICFFIYKILFDLFENRVFLNFFLKDCNFYPFVSLKPSLELKSQLHSTTLLKDF